MTKPVNSFLLFLIFSFSLSSSDEANFLGKNYLNLDFEENNLKQKKKPVSQKKKESSLVYEMDNPSGAPVFSVRLWGEVNKVGLYKAPERSTLLDLIIQSGGPKKQGDVRKISIKRVNGEREKHLTIDLEKVQKNPGVYGFSLMSGDVVYVPRKLIPRFF